MKDIFSGRKCPVCHARFFEEDDIVYCPVCGAPHHRDCWNSLGHCAYESLHGTANQWTEENDPEMKAEPAGNENADYNTPHTSGNNAHTRPNMGDSVCPTCHRTIPNDSLFCPYCGHDFVADQSGQNEQNGPFNPPFAQYPVYPVRFDTPDPLGGVDKEEKIEGVPAKTLGRFVGVNSRRYIPLFARKNKKGKPRIISWNWAAFLIPQYWMVYRKSYVASIFAFACSIITSICLVPFLDFLNTLMPTTGPVTYNQLFEIISGNIDKFSYSSLYLAFGGILLQLIVRIVYGMFGDWFYKCHCVNKIKTLDSKGVIVTDEEYTRKGNVNIFAPIIAYMVYYMVSMLLINLI